MRYDTIRHDPIRIAKGSCIYINLFMALRRQQRCSFSTIYKTYKYHCCRSQPSRHIPITTEITIHDTRIEIAIAKVSTSPRR